MQRLINRDGLRTNWVELAANADYCFPVLTVYSPDCRILSVVSSLCCDGSVARIGWPWHADSAGYSKLYAYGAEFYHFLASFAVQSAQRVVPKLTAVLSIRSVVDFGCGQGAWLSVWEAMGAAVTGVDGPYIDTASLLINPDDFHTADLSGPIELGRQFDLAQSLEVAEHLPPTKAEQFVDTLTAHGSCVLFSAAVPGQGGENHVNEQPLDYWRAIFRKRGYAAIDYLRPLLHDEPEIARWYRNNIILYMRDEAIPALPEQARSCRVPDNQPLADYWPLPCRLGHAIIRRLPRGVVDSLSRTKGALAARRASM